MMKLVGIASIGLIALFLMGKHHHHPSPTPSPTATPTPTPVPTPSPTPSPTATPTPTPVPVVTLAWDSSIGATGYNLYEGFSSGAETTIVNGGDPSTTWTVQLTSGTTYFFTVTAYNDVGESPPSNEISYTVP